MDALKVPVAEVFENWGKEIQPIVGKGIIPWSLVRPLRRERKPMRDFF